MRFRVRLRRGQTIRERSEPKMPPKASNSLALAQDVQSGAISAGGRPLSELNRNELRSLLKRFRLRGWWRSEAEMARIVTEHLESNPGLLGRAEVDAVAGGSGAPPAPAVPAPVPALGKPRPAAGSKPGPSAGRKPERRGKAAPKTSSGPTFGTLGVFGDLPTELVLKILGHLPCSKLARLRSVSRAFSRLAVNPSLWVSIHFALCCSSTLRAQIAVMKAVDEEAKALGVKSIRSCKLVFPHGHFAGSAELLRAAVKHARNLEMLIISDEGSLLSDLRAGELNSLLTVPMPHLEELVFEFSMVRHGEDGPPKQNINRLVRKLGTLCPRLQSLSLRMRDCPWNMGDLFDIGSPSVVTLPSLRHLHLGGTTYYTGRVWDLDVRRIHDAFPNLVELSVAGDWRWAHRLAHGIRMAALDRFTNLERLRLHVPGVEDPDGLDETELREAAFRLLEVMSDPTLAPALKHLDLWAYDIDYEEFGDEVRAAVERFWTARNGDRGGPLEVVRIFLMDESVTCTGIGKWEVVECEDELDSENYSYGDDSGYSYYSDEDYESDEESDEDEEYGEFGPGSLGFQLALQNLLEMHGPQFLDFLAGAGAGMGASGSESEESSGEE
ncbi:hypothetical protein DFJ74DRAFT_658830 [Hyaloraphidium curvatum]|nr:hypothetical protein DFJ74DRAFT_658830 [Hyaloraphidium curvatum]